jgi:hypothetical protein
MVQQYFNCTQLNQVPPKFVFYPPICNFKIFKQIQMPMGAHGLIPTSGIGYAT